ncbi:FimV/HubP family polar landmark protein [Enterovibrio norvegicus]|uniref:FimV/HubP family polar landmark protein n=1 Tax=Enterovibrio norvegicus TaxID=188144 RepID=UPI003FA38D24
MSDADFNNVMKRSLFSSSISRRLGKTLAVTSLLLSVITTFSVQSAIRIIGPQEEAQPQATSEPLSRAATPSTRGRSAVGPTRDSDTLWSIASRYQPNQSVSVYQTIGAIFRLNPSAFEDANIHGLMPGSTLVMPSLAEIRRESTDDVAQRLQIDQARKEAQRTVNRRPLSEQVPAPKPKAPETPTVAPMPAPETAMAEDKKSMMDDAKSKEAMADTDGAMSEKMADAGEKMTPPKPDMMGVQDQINESDMQMGKLVESNHILKIRLAEVQNELSALKEQMTVDQELTGEIKEFLEVQRVRQAKMETKEPSFLETLMNSPLMLATVAIIPALIVIGAAAFIIMRRRKSDDAEEPEGLDGEVPDDMNVIMVPEVEDDTDELVLEDDELEVTEDTDADDLFGDDSMFDSELDDINLSDSLELSEEPEESGVSIDDEFEAGSDISLDDDFDASSELNVAASSDDAIGLEDMERALDEMADNEEKELSPDEALAAAWEQSLAGGDDGDVDDIDALLNAEQSGGSDTEENTADDSPDDILTDDDLNDALFDKVLEGEPEVDLSQDIDLSDDDAPVAAEASGQDDIDDIFSANEASGQDDIDDILNATEASGQDDIDDILNATETSGQDDIDDILGETETLLDELVDDVDENGEAIVSEEIDDSDDLSITSDSDDVDISESDALLDAFLNGDDDEDALDETTLLDESVDDDDLLDEVLGESADDEEVDLGETDVLLDELLGDDDLDDESAVLDELPEDGDDLLSLDDEDLLLASSDADEMSSDDLSSFDDPLDIDGVTDSADDDNTTSEDTDEKKSEETLDADTLSALDVMDDPSESDDDVEAPLETPVDEALESDESADELSALLDSVAEEETTDEQAYASSIDTDELDALVSDGVESDEIVPEASETEMGLLDDVLENSLDEENDASSELEDTVNVDEEDIAGLIAEDESVELESEPEASDSDLALLDSLLDDVDDSDEEQQAEESEKAVESARDTEPLEVRASDAELDVADDDTPLDLSDVPEYDEEAALADSESDASNAERESTAPDASASDEERDASDDEFDLSSLPEYTEEDAAAEFDVPSSRNDLDVPTSSLIEQALRNNDVAVESENETGVEDNVSAPSDLGDTDLGEADIGEADIGEADFGATENHTLAFPPVDAISIDDLGEFDEEDALGAALDEQRELDEAVPPNSHGEFSQPSAPQSLAMEMDELSSLEDDAHQVAGLNMDALLSESMDDEPMALSGFETDNDLATLETLETDDETSFDSDDLSFPDDESDIWQAEMEPEPELETEDWSEQPEILGNDVKDMDLDGDLEGLLEDAESELIEESSSDDAYISIEELMKDDGSPQDDPDTVPMDLNVGLDDFPDVLGDIEPADVDSSGEAATNMDLAKAYLEMNDVDGALQLLEKVMRGDDAALKAEAKQMIENLN